MKIIKYIFFVLLIIPLLISCGDEDGIDMVGSTTTQLITFQNFTGTSGCNDPDQGETVTFIITYGSFLVDIDIEAGNEAYLNVTVGDGESINVKVQRTSDDTLLADANVSVRTESRPEELNGEPRNVIYCEVFDLYFQNF